MEISFEQTLFYDVKSEVPIRDVAEALLALERTIRRSIPSIEALYPGTTITDLRITLPALKTGSLIETIGVIYLFGSQENLVELARQFRAHPFETMKRNKVFALVIAALMLEGGWDIADRLMATPNAKTQIENNYNIVIQTGERELAMASGDFRKAIQKSLRNASDRTKNANDAVRIIRPSKQDNPAEIRLFTPAYAADPVVINAETVKAVPNGTIEEEESFEDFVRAEVDCRIINRDGPRGWQARIPVATNGEARIPITLPKSVDPERIMKQPYFYADITVVYEPSEGDKRIPKRAFIHTIHEPVVEINQNKLVTTHE